MTPIEPMLCISLDRDKIDITKYFHKRNITYLFSQPKLNGIRAIWNHQSKSLYTRNGNKITSVPHIVAALDKVEYNLDGELYTDKLPFNVLNGVVRRIEPSPESALLEYEVFDLPYPRPQVARLLALSKLKCQYGIKPMKCWSIEVEAINEAYREYLAEGYEGIILRHRMAFYKGGRHVGNLWKIKPVYETEGTFVCFLEAKTELHRDTFGSMLLKHSNGESYSCSGITEFQRQHLWDNPPHPGEKITVKFGDWSLQDASKRVPLFPRFKCVRWDS